MLDRLKDLGFKASTRAGLSFGKDDIVIPDAKAKVVKATELEVDKIEASFLKGQITDGERYLKIVDLWTL